ncbi:hypothetical protein RGB72_11035 [Glutamicibacter protophormiae]|uniref:hypothetical protein n=1 Tax=Kocuria TaxID=57493 RepID=UPI0009F88E4C|nr:MULTISPECIES: hypothetical protein [Kocuria]MDN5631254.1 hypothetical protein [Kocuria sp.]WNB88486.1 hypothetical protein RGB72_11035 [Glutamicibacter protophormiae]
MKFNFRRAKTPAYLTSLALIVLGLIFAVASVGVLAWILTILGVALNVMAVSITAIDESPSRARSTGTRVVEEPEADTEQHDAVPAAGSRRVGSSPLRRPEDRRAEDRVHAARESSTR